MDSRRKFLRNVSLAAMGAIVVSQLEAQGFSKTFAFFDPVDVKNPLAAYPNRDWEKTYRDLWKHESEFTFLCAPNDTHNCLLKAHVKNDTIVRIAPSFGFSHAEDLQGNKASARWEPRCCQKGLALHRRFYGDRRVKSPVAREGFLLWVKDGFPRESNGKAPAKYFEGRGKEPFVKITWEEASELTAKVLQNIATTYNGKKGKRYLEEQGYAPEMIEATHGKGVQVLKFRGGMAALGVTRIFGMNRFANSLALLDSKINKCSPEEAKGARAWDSFAWHTDLPPGHAMVTGQQAMDYDLVCVEHSDHIVVWGMNWITTKMPDAHWLTEARMKGAKVTVIACEYSATANKADNVLIVRPGVTPALALGFTNVIINENLFDVEYVKKFTDMPFLVRMDNNQFLKPTEVIKDYQNKDIADYIHVMKEGEKATPMLKQAGAFVSEKDRKDWGDFMIWDEKLNAPKPICRDDYGKKMNAQGIFPSLEGKYKVTLLDGKEVEVRTVFDLIKQYVNENFTPEIVSEITWAPVEGIKTIARDIAKNS
ncbi:MAG: molybdopterin-dependent oxidoreductase, partial [Bacteroidota bacterium]|nr:molybdopterin-dependent oxidoreductase [Bacteroidota bacterium]